jgi:hypothetical protein
VRLDHLTPPGKLRELSAGSIAEWTRRRSDEIDAAIKGPSKNKFDSPRAQFYNPLRTETADDAVEKSVFWTAFPRTVLVNTSTDRQRWEQADASREHQDEYCEWAVQKINGKVTRVTFTCEVPEYWDLLAEDDPDQLLALYQDFVGPEVKKEDLFERDGTYKRANHWNTSTEVGPVHLVQGSNNLFAAIQLAGAATIPRVINGAPKTAEQDLIRCGDFGIRTRNSDPHIGAVVNELARMDADITFADPPGLYINDFTPAGWTTPDRTDAKSFWRYTRGEKGFRLRGVYEVPPDKDYVVGDIKIRGQPIVRGGQIADFVSIKLTGLACRFGKSQGEPFTACADGSKDGG